MTNQALKTVKTNVTDAELIAAQGGVGGTDAYLWATMPVDYRVERVTANDIVHDAQIRVVDEPEPMMVSEINGKDWATVGAGSTLDDASDIVASRKAQGLGRGRYQILRGGNVVATTDGHTIKRVRS